MCFYLRAFEFKFREVFGSCEEVSYTNFFFLIERQAVLFSQICPERHLIRCMLFEISARSIPSPFSYTLPSLQARNTDNKGHKCPPNYNPGRDVNSNTNPNLKITRIQTLTLKLQTSSLRLDLAGHFVMFAKSKRAWVNAFLDKSVILELDVFAIAILHFK